MSSTHSNTPTQRDISETRSRYRQTGVPYVSPSIRPFLTILQHTSLPFVSWPPTFRPPDPSQTKLNRYRKHLNKSVRTQLNNTYFLI